MHINIKILENFDINPSRPDPQQWEKFNVKFLFSDFFVVLQKFYEGH